MREAYRLNKATILTEKVPPIPYVIAYVYLSRDKMIFNVLQNKLKNSLKRLKIG